ncbi:hypothetical protein EHP00_358 [Ecytonucleospora hepatopenaei]|uniref:Uncharacterized protein n=1 Tax=Ecytonucleospora hepatopenaei TaxID=646526 RepID=A0A1W0E9B7_9MICR|nr:hypothetical protein EHP00_358 [Ecytonucleospora hepatopenaei]
MNTREKMRNENLSNKKDEIDLKMRVSNCFTTNNYQEIATTATKLEEINKEHPYVLVLNALYNIKVGKFCDAHSFLIRYVKEHKKLDVFVLECMALWNYSVGRYEIAIKQYVKLLNFYNKNYAKKVQILFNISLCKKELGFYDFALEILERLLALPNGYMMLPRIYIQTFHIYLLKKNYAHVKNLLKIFKFPVNNPFLNRIYAQFLYGYKCYEDLIELVNASSYDTYLYYLAIRTGDFINLHQEYYFEEILSFSENNFYILNTYGNFIMKKGFVPTALQYYDMALSLNPEYRPAYKNREFITKHSKKLQNGKITYDSNILELFVPNDVEPEVCKFGFFNVNITSNNFASLPNYKFLETSDILDL